MKLPYAEPFRIKMVENIQKTTKAQRTKWIQEASYNLFNLQSQRVFIDLLTDSGTGAMSDNQWSKLMLGDESYAGSSSYYNLKEAIKDILGFSHFLPTHQGRAAENVLFSVMIKEGNIIPGNAHFDTTKGHIELRKAVPIDCTIEESKDIDTYHPFKGNVDIKKLEQTLNEHKGNVPFVIVTVTCNSVGGQPVSMENLRQVKKIAEKHNVPVVFDSARFAENAYFIKKREDGYAHKTIREIVKEMFSYADMMTMSSKKDAIVNMGGFIGIKDEKIYQQAMVYSIMFEGFVSYGGMSGRDMNALAQGLYEGTEFDYLEARISQVEYLGQKLINYKIPVQKPFGGHAVFVDANKILENIPVEQFRAQTLAVELYIEAGIRTVEIGSILADRDPVTRKERYAKNEYVRLAIPRRTYTNNHMDYIAAAFKNVFDRRNEIKTGFKIKKEAPILRHFTVELERI